jgi:hypothetical protein
MLVVGGNYKGDLQVYQKTCLEIWIVQDWEFSPLKSEYATSKENETRTRIASIVIKVLNCKET